MEHEMKPGFVFGLIGIIKKAQIIRQYHAGVCLRYSAPYLQRGPRILVIVLATIVLLHSLLPFHDYSYFQPNLSPPLHIEYAPPPDPATLNIALQHFGNL